MLVDITITERKSLLLKDEDLKSITEKYLRETLKINNDMFINSKGNLVEKYKVGGGSHSWNESKTVRKATEEDKAFFLLIKKL